MRIEYVHASRFGNEKVHAFAAQLPTPRPGETP
jgi:hypothetical protein